MQNLYDLKKGIVPKVLTPLPDERLPPLAESSGNASTISTLL